ncbi:hypothetical protein Hanom_Chr07g00632661 [Helianthus anomalus]
MYMCYMIRSHNNPHTHSTAQVHLSRNCLYSDIWASPCVGSAHSPLTRIQVITRRVLRLILLHKTQVTKP